MFCFGGGGLQKMVGWYCGFPFKPTTGVNVLLFVDHLLATASSNAQKQIRLRPQEAPQSANPARPKKKETVASKSGQ